MIKVTQTPDHIDDGRMIDLLNGLVQDDVASVLLAHLKTCADCEQRFVRLARHHETLRSRPSPYLSADGRITQRSSSSRGPRRWTLSAVGLLVAAVAVLAVIVPRMLPPADSGAGVYWMPTEDDERTIRAREDVSNLRHLAEGVEAYRKHDLDRATDALESIEFGRLQQEFESIRRLYLASAYVNEQRYEAAIELLPEWAMVHFPMPWRQRARWVAYLANRGAGNAEAASQLLDTLVEAGGDIGKRAREERERVGASD